MSTLMLGTSPRRTRLQNCSIAPVRIPGMPSDQRRGILRDALGIAVASGAYAISFGAISTAAGLSLLQTCALSVVMFTGA